MTAEKASDSKYQSPTRDKLTVCNEDTTETKPTADIFNTDGTINLTKYESYDGTFTAEESVFLVHSKLFNTIDMAVELLGDKTTLKNCRVRGNQDAIYVANGRSYFEDCDLIGETDYIDGGASIVLKEKQRQR